MWEVQKQTKIQIHVLSSDQVIMEWSMADDVGSTMSSLLKTDKCSPLIVYIVLVIVSGITLFNTNGLMFKLLIKSSVW